jgi:hypothetical protein
MFEDCGTRTSLVPECLMPMEFHEVIILGVGP